MSGAMSISPKSPITKTRNAILRMKKCSPELREVLRQRCQERIYNDRLKILNTIRQIKIQNNFKVAFSNIVNDECKNIADELKDSNPDYLAVNSSNEKFNIENELLLEELIEKELLTEYEEWLLQQYEELLLDEEHDTSNDVVCPLCCSGFLEVNEFKRISCKNCGENFFVEKSLPDLEVEIFKLLAWHNKQCNQNPTFINVPNGENESNLCIFCNYCSFSNVIM